MLSNPKPHFSFLRRLALIFSLLLIGFSTSILLRGGFDPVSRAAVNAETPQSSFARAELTQQTLNYISHNYYDPSRPNPKQMLKGGLMSLARAVPEIVVDFPDNAARITVAVEGSEKKFTLPVMDKSVEPIVPFVQQIFAFIEKEYKGDVEYPDIERAFINGMLEALDPHSSLLAPKIFKEFKTQTEGEFGGLGIVIGLKDGDLTVVAPLEGTPAWKAGIKPKDKIIKIGNEATINMNLNEAVEKLRGKVGSQVTLMITREGLNDPFEVTLTRAKIKIDSIRSKLIHSPEGDVGYIKVKSFQEDTYRELLKALSKIKSQAVNFKGLILDFRDNPGGLLSQAIQISDLFLDHGVIVSTVGAGNKIREVEEAHGSGTEDKYPIVVLVNDSSASASEIVAGALKNNNRAIVVGEQTFGKGSVQSVYSLKDGSALKLTIAQYLTPGNESIQSVGITPDILLIPGTIQAEDTKILATEGFREKDLDQHLESSLSQNKKPTYQLLYFLPKKPVNPDSPDKDKEEDTSEYSSDVKLDNDFYATLARKLILSTSNAERPSFLKQSETTEKAQDKEEEQKITQALSQIGVDWSTGAATGKPQAQVTFNIEGKQPGEAINAGEEAKLTLQVKNVGNGDFYRLIAKTDAETPLFKNKEFIFGHVKSGETKSWTTKIKIPETAFSREDEIRFNFEEANNKIPESFSTTVLIDAKPRPSFAYSYRLVSPSKDAIQKGDTVKLIISVKNIGSAKLKEAVVNIKNLEGESVFVSEGRSKLQELEPGATKEANFAFSIDKNFDKKKVGIEISILDMGMQDGLSDKLSIGLGSEPSSPAQNALQTPPVIQLTGIEGARSTSINKFYISGNASSDVKMKDVIIFVNDTKVYLKSVQGESPTKIVFADQAPLDKKMNLISIVARDQRNLASHRSFYIRKK